MRYKQLALADHKKGIIIDENAEIQFYGPFQFTRHNKKSILSTSLEKLKGIYLWTIPFENKYLTYYVGETGKSFAERNVEHVSSYYNGFYRIYNPDEFAKGKKDLVWGGMWKSDRKNPQIRIEYQRRCDELSSVSDVLLSQIRVFLVPLEGDDRRIRQRLEAAIAFRLREQSGVIGSFQDDDVRYCPRWPDEPQIKVKLKTNELLLGLDGELTI